MKNSTQLNIKRVVYGALLIALGMILPNLFHMFGGSSAGRVFLPMHLVVLLAGMILGPLWGAAVAVILPVLSSLTTGMPAVPMLYLMLFELVAYAVISGFCARKMDPYFTLPIAMVGGRLFYALVLYIAAKVFKMNVPAVETVITAFTVGLPGIAVQLIFIPPIWYALRKGGFLLVYKGKGKKSY